MFLAVPIDIKIWTIRIYASFYLFPIPSSLSMVCGYVEMTSTKTEIVTICPLEDIKLLM